MEMAIWDLRLRNGVAEEVKVDMSPDATYGQAVMRAVCDFKRNLEGVNVTDVFDVMLYHTEYTPDIDCITYTFYIHKKDN